MSWSRTLKVRQVLRAQLEAGEEISLLFSDIRGFVAFTASRGDRAAFRLSQLHEGILRARIDEYGIVVKSLGDGIMAAFEKPVDAVRAAVAIQRAVRERNREEDEDPIDVGIGVSTGTPVMTDIDFIGHSVNRAQRLSAFAKGGQILVTEEIQRSVGASPEWLYVPLGSKSLRGLGLERVVEVAWLREVARISDGRDRVTLILTDEGMIVVEMAKDPKQGIREGLEALGEAKAAEEGPVSALLQRGVAHLLRRLLGEPMASDVEREFPLDRAELCYRRGVLRVRAPGGDFELAGVARADAEQFLQETEQLISRRPGGSQEKKIQ
ncbi:adenylate/guanylate cyclase domain-containing protein [Candidatus Bipolaricaulota bacterium]